MRSSPLQPGCRRGRLLGPVRSLVAIEAAARKPGESTSALAEASIPRGPVPGSLQAGRGRPRAYRPGGAHTVARAAGGGARRPQPLRRRAQAARRQAARRQPAVHRAVHRAAAALRPRRAAAAPQRTAPWLAGPWARLCRGARGPAGAYELPRGGAAPADIPPPLFSLSGHPSRRSSLPSAHSPWVQGLRVQRFRRAVTPQSRFHLRRFSG